MVQDRTVRPHWSLPLVLAGVGAIAGVISLMVFVFLMIFGLGTVVLAFLAPAAPGLIFGLIVCGTVGKWYSVPPGLDIRFTALSALAFFLVFFLGIVLSKAGKSEAWQDGAICGVIAAGILTAYVRTCVTGFSHILGPVFMVFAGTLLGAILMPFAIDVPYFGLVFLFVGWQSGFAASLGVALRRCRVPKGQY